MPLQFITQIFWVHDEFPDREVLYVGLVSASRGLAMLVFGLIGGAFADRYERRRILLLGQSSGFVVNALIALSMLMMPFGDATFFVILALTFVAASVIAVDNPARNASLPDVVSRDHLAGAVSFNMMAMQLAFPVTLPLAGILNERFDAGAVYAGTLVIWLAILPMIAALRFRSSGDASASGGVLANISAGLRYTRRDRLIFAVIAIVLAIQVVGMPGPGSLAPVWMTSVLDLSESEFGLIAMLWGIGAVLASLAFTRFPGVASSGITLCAAALLFAVASIVFAHSRSIPITSLANVCLGVGLASTMLSGTAIAQQAVADDMRGRVMGLFPLAMGLALLAAAPVSAAAQALSLESVVAALAWLTLGLVGALTFAQPGLRRYRGARSREAPGARRASASRASHSPGRW